MANSLDAALSGLRIAQQQLSVISSNIANVQTDGYSRKILPQSTRVVAGEAVGVSADPVIRKVDLFLARDVWTQTSSVGYSDIQINYLKQIENFHGSSDSEKNIAAKIADVRDSFIALSDQPQDTYSLNAVVASATTAASQINEYADLLNQMRNDTEDDMSRNITRINALLEQIAAQNQEVKSSHNLNRSSAAYEDIRDKSIKELSQLMDISFFSRGDGVLVIQTRSGAQLADELPNELYFAQSSVGVDEYYPDTVNGIYLGGNPITNQNAVDITETGVGGELGGLLALRDTIIPRYQAQLDETAFRLAQRFDSLGLRLLTDENGNIPNDTAPVPNPPGPLTPVDYIGFSAEIQVNPNVIDDPTLIQSGTTGHTVQTGSNEVIRRVINFSFGTIEYQAVEGSRDIRVSANPAGDTLQENMGLYSSNTLLSTKNLSEYTTDANTASGNPFGSPPTNDDFTLRIYDTRIAIDSGTITIDLAAAATAYPIGSAGLGTGIGTVNNAAEQMASYINSLAWPASMAVAATVNIYGQLSIATRGSVDIGAGTMGTAGLSFLGFEAGTTTTTDPYFDVQVGNDTATRITIEPGETETDLVTKIDAVPGIATTDIVINASGYLSFRPELGGDIKIVGGPFTSTTGFSTTGGLGIIQEIFGSSTPVVDHNHTAFRNSNLGPNVAIDTSIISATTIIDFGQKMVDAQIQDKINVQNTRDDDEQYRATLEKQLTDESGVNVDEELATMIVIQSAYAAAARAISTVNEMFQELLDAFR